MDINISAIKDLLDRYLLGNASPAEHKMVEEWLMENEFPDNEWNKMDDESRSLWMNALRADLDKKLHNNTPTPSEERLQIAHSRYGRMYLPFAAAALMIAVAGSWYFFFKEKPAANHVDIATGPKAENDAMPGTNKAILTLEDGRTVSLDDSQNGVLAKQGDVEISKNGSQLVYDGSAQRAPSNIAYNTLSTPRGGQYNLVLPDGSKVWLNAASSLRYPVAFAKNKREVEIKGEAYFEVATQKNGNIKVPFIVKVNGEDGLLKSSVEVLGTHFNINAYDEEETVNTTLLEGKVKVLPPGSGSSAVLLPGQQSRVNKAGATRVIEDADVEEAVAWKNGLFLMNSADIPVVLRQLGRWYDVDIIYSNKVPEGKISGDIPRSMKLSEVLKIMKLSGVDFKITGKQIIVGQE
ncbi:MAG: FecR domain-containing protein [Chitinophagaceae bacterium]|nr:FecR domain-containing protein [Chitinophagaceae bacterium]